MGEHKSESEYFLFAYYKRFWDLNIITFSSFNFRLS